MRVLLAPVLLLVTTSALHADPPRAGEPAVVQSVVAQVDTRSPDPRLEPVIVREQSLAGQPAAEAAQEMPRRGGLVWVIGAVAVAVLIAVLVL